MEFDEYVDQHGRALLRLAYVLTSDAQQAEDLTQTALTNAYRHWRRVRRAASPHAYVRRTLVNAHLSSRRLRSSTEIPTDAIPEPDGPASDPADAFANQDELRQLLATLAPRARTVLVLRYFADLNDSDIAEAMGVTPSAVRATASRALAQLRTTHTDATQETT